MATKMNLDKINSRILELIGEFGWSLEDEIIVKISGSRTSGVKQTDGANPKWSPPFGDVRHNPDAQIVIENVSRRDDTKSQPRADKINKASS